MAGTLPGFFVQPHPTAAFRDLIILNLDLNRGADGGERVAHEPDQGAIRGAR